MNELGRLLERETFQDEEQADARMGAIIEYVKEATGLDRERWVDLRAALEVIGDDHGWL